MAKGQKYIIVDSYTNDLLQEIVNQGKASSPSEAVAKSVASYLGIRYKSRQERQMEEELSTVLELGKKVTKEE